METFTDLRGFVDNPTYAEQRRARVGALDINIIDAPIVEIISGLARWPCCFTLQSCYGHFLYDGQQDPRNVEPLPVSDSIVSVEYRIAYLALCIENSPAGHRLFESLREIPEIDPDYVQFGCAGWFWTRQVNSYALQVEPKRFMTQDRATIDYREALHVEKIRGEFFSRLKGLLKRQLQPGYTERK